MTDETLRRRIEALGPWFHNIEVAPGLFTPPATSSATTRR